jgi:hypothetical protein
VTMGLWVFLCEITIHKILICMRMGRDGASLEIVGGYHGTSVGRLKRSRLRLFCRVCAPFQSICCWRNRPLLILFVVVGFLALAPGTGSSPLTRSADSTYLSLIVSGATSLATAERDRQGLAATDTADTQDVSER